MSKSPIKIGPFPHLQILLNCFIEITDNCQISQSDFHSVIFLILVISFSFRFSLSMVKKIIILVILCFFSIPLVGGTATLVNRLKSFLFLYCQTYESKDLDKFAALFTPDALENNRPFYLLLPKYRKNIEMIESFDYRIELRAYFLSAGSGNIKIRGKYFTRFMYDGTLKENSGNIFMELRESGNSYLVKQINYTSRSENKEGKQSEWGPWVEIIEKE